MQYEELTQLVISTLEDNKGINIKPIEVTELTEIMDVMIVCTATSTRHAKTLADKIAVASKEAGVMPLGIEGDNTSDWILIDLGDVVVHIMQADSRDFYNLEKLWTAVQEAREKEV